MQNQIVLLLVAAMVSCHSGNSSDTSVPPTAPLVSIDVTPSSPTATPVYCAGYGAFTTMRRMMTAYPTHTDHVAGLVNDNGYWVEKFSDAGDRSLSGAFVPIRFDPATGIPRLPPPAAQEVTIVIHVNRTASITTMNGSSSPMTADGAGNVTLLVNAEPVYLEVL